MDEQWQSEIVRTCDETNENDFVEYFGGKIEGESGLIK